MARIPEAELERLRSEISVERLVEASGVELKAAGKDLLGRCPFHDDREASLVVTPAKNLWHCFACQIGGGPIDWVMKTKGVSFRHAVELLREGAASGTGAIELPARAGRGMRALPPPVHLDAGDQALLEQAIVYYHERLKQTPEALAYLARRGLDDAELIERFKLGFADRSLGLRLPEKTRKAGHEIRTRLQRLGLLRESGHEHFNGSIVIPVVSPAGEITEVYGRKINDNLREGTPYHLYLPGPHRGVWNESALEASREVLLCEALIDALTFWRAGYRNVTASYSIEGFTEDHLAAFKRHGTRRVLVAYDRDEPGERAAERLVHRGMRGQSFVYELLFDGEVTGEAPHLSGLIDAATIASSRGLDPRVRALNAGSKRPQRGGLAVARSLSKACKSSRFRRPARRSGRNAHHAGNGRDASYTHAVESRS